MGIDADNDRYAQFLADRRSSSRWRGIYIIVLVICGIAIGYMLAQLWMAWRG